MLRLTGGEIIWEGLRFSAYRKRGAEVIRSVERDQEAWGFVGSDRVNEDGYGGFKETVEPIRNSKGQTLRFALIATNALRLRTKLINNEPIRVVTSYPMTAARLLERCDDIEYVQGCVEAELVDREKDFDGGFELVQSGDSVRTNGLEIVEDDIEVIRLEALRTPYDW